MHRFLLHNGEIRDAGEICLSPGQVGLLSGWGVFSTIRIYDGVLFAWERHWARMESDARLLRVPFPRDSDALLQDLTRLVDANQAWNATLRVSVVRNRGGMWEGPAAARDFDVMGFTSDVRPWGPQLKLDLVPGGRFAASEFAGAKSLAWAENLVRYERANEQGFDEVVLLNERGEVCECTSANIFVVQGNVVRTPPLSSGCLPGVTRALLLEEVRVPDIPVRESVLLPGDLETADGILISSTTRELLPATVAGLNISLGAGPVCDRLRSALKAYVGAYVAARRRPVAVV